MSTYNGLQMQAQKPPIALEGRNAEKFINYWQYWQRLVFRFNLKYGFVHRSIKTSKKHINLNLSSKLWRKKKISSASIESGVAHPIKMLSLADMHWRVSHNVLSNILTASLLFHCNLRYLRKHMENLRFGFFCFL